MTRYSELNLSTIELEEKSRQIRIDILKAIHKAGKGHIGGAFSIVEILVSLYYGNVLKFDSKNPSGRFVTDLFSVKDMPGWHYMPCLQISVTSQDRS